MMKARGLGLHCEPRPLAFIICWMYREVDFTSVVVLGFGAPRLVDEQFEVSDVSRTRSKYEN